MEEIEVSLASDISVLQGFLSHSEKRNKSVHTHTTGQTEQLNAPSTILKWVDKAYPVLKKIFDTAKV